MIDVIDLKNKDDKDNKDSSEMIKKYLEEGGNVTQCKPFSPSSKSNAIRTKGTKKRDEMSKKYRKSSMY